MRQNEPTIKHLPPAALRDHLLPELAAPLSDLERLRGQADAARQDATEAEFAVQRAEQQDRRAAADHVRGKVKQAPKPTEPEAREKLAEAEKNAKVLALAASDAEAELEDLIEAHRDELSARLDKFDVERQAECREATREAAGARSRGDGGSRPARLACGAWQLLLRPGKFRTRSEVRKASGEAYTLDELLALAEAGFAPPEPKPKTRPLRRVA